MHFCGVCSGAAVDIPTFIACVFLLPAVVRGVGVHLATAKGVMLGAHGVFKPDGLSSATDANHGEGAMSTAQRTVIDTANDERAGLLKSGSCHSGKFGEREKTGNPSRLIKVYRVEPVQQPPNCANFLGGF